MTHNFRMSESGAQLFARLEGWRSLKDIEPHIFPEGGPVQGDVVELHGTEGTAKTETLYHLLTRCILPARHGGLEVEVVFVDTDHHFDMLRLVSVLEGRLARGAEEATEGASEEESLRSCLRRLSVAHCSSSAQLLLTLHYLEGVFRSRAALRLLVIDSISAFYWVDRSSGGESVARQEANLRKCAELLDRLRRDYGVMVFATTHAVMRNYAAASDAAASGPSEAPPSSSWRWRSSASAADFDKPYLCRAWQRIVTHRVLFSKGGVAKDKKQVFLAACTTTRTRGVKRCSFCVTDGGVTFS